MKIDKISLNRTKIFFSVYLFFNSISFVIHALLPSYLNYKTSEAISATVFDGPWCSPATQGLGVHCFGDFYYSIQFANLDNPWSGKANPYPPLGTAFFKPFTLLDQFFPNTRLALIIYLILCLICLFFPVYHAKKTQNLSLQSIAVVVSIIVTSTPILMGLDRGNLQLVIFPFLYLFCHDVIISKNSTFIWGVVLVLFKPQMILLGIIFVAHREWKNLRRWLLLNILASFFAFLIYPIHIKENVLSYFAQMVNYQNYTNAGSPNPANISIASTWFTLERIITTILPSHFSKDPNGRWSYYPNWITVIMFFLVVILVGVYGRERSRFENLYIAILMHILFTNVTFGYYLSILLPPLILHFIACKNYYRSENITEVKGSRTQYFHRFMSLEKKSIWLTFTFTYVLLMIPWGLPWRIFPGFHYFFWSSIGVNWLFGQIFLLIFFINLIFLGAKRPQIKISL